MDDLRKRIWNELFVAPSVVLPIVGGATAWLLSWAAGGIDWLNGLGLVGVIVGVGWFATRWIFQIDAITEKALRDQVADQLRREEATLEDLAKRLRENGEKEAFEYLSLLRINRADVERVAQQPGIQIRSLEIVRQARQLFWASIDQLEQASKLRQLANQLSGTDRQHILGQRERCLAEAKESVEHLRAAADTFRQFGDRSQERELDSLQKDLAESILAAKKSEERMRELESSPDYESFLKESP